MWLVVLKELIWHKLVVKILFFIKKPHFLQRHASCQTGQVLGILKSSLALVCPKGSIGPPSDEMSAETEQQHQGLAVNSCRNFYTWQRHLAGNAAFQIFFHFSLNFPWKLSTDVLNLVYSAEIVKFIWIHAFWIKESSALTTLTLIIF